MVRQGLLEMGNVCLGLTKWGLIIFNIIFWCMGVVSLAIGLWLYITANEFASISDGQRLLGAVFLVATGCGVVIVGFMGIVAAIRESRIIATMFCLLTLVALGMYLASGVWSHAVLSGIGDDVRTDLNKTIPSYDRVLAYQRVWDTLHQRYECCGMTGSIDWVLYRGPLLPHPPPSCCVDEGCGQFFTIGCASALEKYERKQLEIIGPIGLAFGLFQVVGVVISILFCWGLGRSKGTYYT